MRMHVGGKGENDEEIEINMKRFQFDERKRTYYVVTLTAVISYFFISVSKLFPQSFVLYFAY